MTYDSTDLMTKTMRSSWIRIRTMILVRWIAIFGQLTALFVSVQIFDLVIEVSWCLFAIGLSILGNIVATVIYPETKRLSESENMMMIMFDLCQLAFLLFLTGGLNNPFSVLLLAPVVIASSVLTLGYAALIAATALFIITLLAFFHISLRTEQLFILRTADLFVFGNWVAIGVGMIFLSLYARRVTQEMNTMGDALFATQMALEREQKLTALGGVVAAAAHELGTPLATIKLTSAELMDELEHEPDLYEDAKLIRDQADRCRDILRSMGRAGKDDKHMQTTPLTQLIQEAADPHLDRGISINIQPLKTLDAREQPIVNRRPEIIHGLRNMIQNAVDFARTHVWVEVEWTTEVIVIRIMDDGKGYPSDMLGRLGDPFVGRRRSSSQKKRPGYEGMGLGLFIAKTLLERTGALLIFANGGDGQTPNKVSGQPKGAIVEISWPRASIEITSTKLGDNQLLM